MGVNKNFNNYGVRERPMTVAPLPYSELLQSLNQKQEMYNLAESFEINEKAKISSLSSPVAGWNDYLQNIKGNYLKAALELHNSIPDKGSSEYRRKSQELVSSVVNDRIRQNIETDTQDFSKYLSEKAIKINGNKYKHWRDNDKGFTGVDAAGNILRYHYTGFSDGEDWRTIQQGIIDKVPERETSFDYTNPVTGHRSVVQRKIKSAKEIKAVVNSTMTPAQRRDKMEDLGLTSEEELNKYDDIYFKGHVKNDLKTIEDFNPSIAKYNDDKNPAYGEAFEMTKVAPNTERKEMLNSLIGDDGKLIPTTSDFKYSAVPGMTAARAMSYLMREKSPENTYAELKKQGIPMDEIAKSAKKFGVTFEKALSDFKVANTGHKTLTGDIVGTAKERKDIEEDLEGTFLQSSIKDMNGNEISYEDKQKFDVSKLRLSGKLTPYNPFGPHTWEISVQDPKHPDSQEILFMSRTKRPEHRKTPEDYFASQENKIYNATLNGDSFVDLPEGYIDPYTMKPEGVHTRVNIYPGNPQARIVEQLKNNKWEIRK